MDAQKLFLGAYVGGAAWLLGWEIAAFGIGRRDLTISDFTWRLEGAGWTAARYFVLIAMVWLTLHLVWKVLR
jgi:branched-subunit amino acid ABC-type transport system permease component